MKFIKMKCNNCNAPLNVDLDNLQAYCPYCGQKLMMDFNQLAWVLAEKEKTKRAVDREAHQTARTKMAYEYESKEKDKAWKKKVVATCGTAIVCIFLFFFVFYYMPEHLFDSDEKKHDQKVAYLQQLETDMEADIKSGDYDSALLKANRLYCDDHWSSEQTATWDEKRKAYISIIEDRKREKDLQDPSNIFMPASSDSFKGKKLMDVVDQLKGIGFTNITTQIASESPGLFDKQDTVEHILVGGRTAFTAEDYFNINTPIIIYFYSK